MKLLDLPQSWTASVGPPVTLWSLSGFVLKGNQEEHVVLCQGRGAELLALEFQQQILCTIATTQWSRAIIFRFLTHSKAIAKGEGQGHEKVFLKLASEIFLLINLSDFERLLQCPPAHFTGC